MRLVETFQATSDVLTVPVIAKLDDSELREVALSLAVSRVGMSAASLARWAILTPGSDSFNGCLPRDRGDLGRCEMLYDNSPAWLQARMLPLLEEFRSHVAGRR